MTATHAPQSQTYSVTTVRSTVYYIQAMSEEEAWDKYYNDDSILLKPVKKSTICTALQRLDKV